MPRNVFYDSKSSLRPSVHWTPTIFLWLSSELLLNMVPCSVGFHSNVFSSMYTFLLNTSIASIVNLLNSRDKNNFSSLKRTISLSLNWPLNFHSMLKKHTHMLLLSADLWLTMNYFLLCFWMARSGALKSLERETFLYKIRILIVNIKMQNIVRDSALSTNRWLSACKYSGCCLMVKLCKI